MGSRRYRWVGAGVVLALLGSQSASGAADLSLWGKPVSLMGYVDQGVSTNIGKGKSFDNKDGLNSAVFSTLLEGDYRPGQDLKVYVAGKFTADWIYPLLAGNQEWKDKEFDKSRDELYVDTGWDKMLHEAYVTWSPGNFFLRVGKQIVGWGETDGFRLMDQINPVDQRRGLGDVEFENTIIPIWLVRADYHLQPQSRWLQDIAFETVFNPNARFQPDRPIDLGNDVSGVWAPDVVPFPGGQLGSSRYDNKAPGDWERGGMEFGARVKGVVSDMIISLNYFNGLSNAAQLKLAGAPDVTVAPDGTPVLHLPLEQRYPRYQMVGATFTSDFPSMSSSMLGGVAPVLRLEAERVFNNTMGVEGGFSGPPFERYIKKDEIRYVVGVDWKVKADFLNPKAYFFLSGQFYHRKILDFEKDQTPAEIAAKMDLKDFLGNVKEDNYITTLLINTTYLHNKLTPQFFWLRDMTLNGNMFKPQITYDYSDKWHYTVGALFLDGKTSQKGFEPLKRKDQLFATVKYRF
ncbi:MAG TPA: hypothetical protein DCZ97_16555 [Syntrophus sp. (in: bacteria)]|nr:hypothetical protein [Syntrophus sp. (in: bacteria)]